MRKSRDNGLDLGRLIAIFFVITLHVFGPLVNMNAAKGADLRIMIPQVIIMITTQSAVNIFFLISGAFLLRSPRTEDYGKLYGKAWRKLAVPTIVFSVIYTVARPLFYVAIGAAGTAGLPGAYGSALLYMFTGNAEAHLWYMFVLIGLYLLAPYICRAKELLGEKHFRTAAIASPENSKYGHPNWLFRILSAGTILFWADFFAA